MPPSLSALTHVPLRQRRLARVVIAITAIACSIGCASDPIVTASLKGDAKAVERALKAGSDPNATDSKRRSALELAVIKQRTEAVRVLASSGANVDVVGPYGRAPLHWAALRNQVEIAKILLANKADPNIKDIRTQSTPLIEAAWANHPKVMKVLLEGGADPNIDEVKRTGGTALHVAVQHRRMEMIRMLLDAGADPTRRSRRGQSAIELAKRTKRPEIQSLLAESRAAAKPYAAAPPPPQQQQPATVVKPASNTGYRQIDPYAVVATPGRTTPPPRSAGSAQGGLQPLPGAAGDVYGPTYGRRVAAVIGINRYEEWPQLEGARGDASRFAETLREIGFDHVEEIYDGEASRERILRLLGTELPQRTGKNDLAVIFFAGHGHTETLPNGEKRGYIVPADSDPRDVFATGISMLTLRELSSRLPAKHVYYAMDSCYSGLGFARGIRIPKSTNGYLDMVRAKRAVQMVTAGGEGEQAFERGGRGLFTSYLIRAIRGEADFDGDGAVTASELGTFVRPQVSGASNQRQTPQFGTIDGIGEVVFDRR
jgi:hypothetical protein